MQSHLANCLLMPDETVEQLIFRLNDICARMVNDPGEAMMKTQVIKGICNEFAAFAQIVARRDMSWAEYCTNNKTKQNVGELRSPLFCLR